MSSDVNNRPDGEPFAPLLANTDWNEEWKSLQGARKRSDDASEWDEKAKTYPVKHGSQEGYAGAFLKLADLRAGETVLDMGCGTGALATPLAQAGFKVIACDFSSGMLNAMKSDQESLGVTGVETHLMSWDDDWERFGLGENSVDVAIASRSIATRDLQSALMKLDRAARRRVCVTLSAGPSPRCDSELVGAAGLKDRMGYDFLYAFNILASNGIAPEVSYIPNTRVDRFDSPEEALRQFTDIVRTSFQGTASRNELADIPRNLKPWLDRRLAFDAEGTRVSIERTVYWAFISWSTIR